MSSDFYSSFVDEDMQKDAIAQELMRLYFEYKNGDKLAYKNLKKMLDMYSGLFYEKDLLAKLEELYKKEK